jgi:hypothetical protein
MTHLPLLSFRGLSRLVGTVGLVSVALALARHALQPALRQPANRAPVRLRAVPRSPSDGHLGATEKEFDWASASRA